MAVTYGFYNSKNGDRVYNAEQFGKLFSGIIRDGILPFAHEEDSETDSFQISPADSGLAVVVHRGRAWFNHTWTDNDSDLTLQLAASNPQQSRIDAIVIEINKSANTDTSVTPNVPDRANGVVVVTGSLSDDPQRPTLQNDPDGITQKVLAYVTVRAGATSIAAGDIYYCVPEFTPYVSGPLRTISNATVFQNWRNTWNEKLQEYETAMNAIIDAAIEEYFGENGEARNTFLPFKMHFRKLGGNYECDKTVQEFTDALEAGVAIDADYWDHDQEYAKVYKLQYTSNYRELKHYGSSQQYTSYYVRVYEFVSDSPRAVYINPQDVPVGDFDTEVLKIKYYHDSHNNVDRIGIFYDDNSDSTFEIVFSGDGQNSGSGTATCDKTFDQIWNAYISGKKLIAKYVVNNSAQLGVVVHLPDFNFDFIGGTKGVSYDKVVGVYFYGNTYALRSNDVNGGPDILRSCYIGKNGNIICNKKSYYIPVSPGTTYSRLHVIIDGDNLSSNTTFSSMVTAHISGDPTAKKPVFCQCRYDGKIYSGGSIMLHQTNGVYDYLVISFIEAPEDPSDPFDIVRVKITSGNVITLDNYQK